MSRYMEVPLEGGQPAQVQVKAIYDRFGKYKKELGVLCSCLCLGTSLYRGRRGRGELQVRQLILQTMEFSEIL